MKLIIDANIIISALISMKGKTRDLIFLEDITLFAPEYLLEEVEKYKRIIIKKSKLDKELFSLANQILFSKIKLIPFSKFKHKIKESKNICPDPDDEEYFALALSKKIPIWTDDKRLKQQSKVKIISTTEMIESFLK